MAEEIGAAADALTAGVLASTVSGEAGTPAKTTHDTVCRNCGAPVPGAFCSACGQAAHVHRSLSAIGHDILHGVFHFDGKIWHTIPMLCFRPGQLTRRYINGERAKFVSPMALFLFAVFTMFAVFSFTGGSLLGGDTFNNNWQANFKAELPVMDKAIKETEQKLAVEGLSPEQRTILTKKLTEQKNERRAAQALAVGDYSALVVDDNGKPVAQNGFVADTGWPALDTVLMESLKKADTNPSLLLYKLKTSGYKYSWALIPISLPFVWLLFFWRRDLHMYDHAIFTTYSISFMMILLVILTLAGVAGLSSGLVVAALVFLPPLHLYKHLKGTYALSRSGAAVRLMFLMLFAGFAAVIFIMLLLVLGLLG